MDISEPNEKNTNFSARSKAKYSRRSIWTKIVYSHPVFICRAEKLTRHLFLLVFIYFLDQHRHKFTAVVHNAVIHLLKNR